MEGLAIQAKEAVNLFVDNLSRSAAVRGRQYLILRDDEIKHILFTDRIRPGLLCAGTFIG
jgi:hypothetical protein